jgi:DHA1 family inner membrane transport protein
MDAAADGHFHRRQYPVCDRAGLCEPMIARVITLFAHGSFFGIGSVVAASLVPQNKRASAIALMFTGLALANVLGVPLGTFIRQMLGWRAASWAVAGAGVLAAIALFVLVPDRHDSGPLSLRDEVGVLAQPHVWLALLMTEFGFGGVFVVFTYITPILEQVSGFAPRSITLLLVLFGVGLAIGNAVGGKLADRGGRRALAAIFTALVAIMAVFSHSMHSRIPAMATLFIWGIAAFATIAALQTRVLSKASNAPDLASTLNVGAFNIGNALGAWLGGLVIAGCHPLDSLPWVAALVSLGVTVVAMRLDARDASAQTAHTTASASQD